MPEDDRRTEPMRSWARHWQWTAIGAQLAVNAVRELHVPETQGGLPTGKCGECGKPMPCPTIRAVPRRPDLCECLPDCPSNAGERMSSLPDGQVTIHPANE